MANPYSSIGPMGNTQYQVYDREARGMGGRLLRDMPGTPQYSQEQIRLQEEQTKKAVTAERAAAQVQTPEERQARIARDLALSQTRGARPSGQDSQFYQPVRQSQYTNYTTTNPLGVSQYGTPMTIRSLVDSAYAGVGRYGSGNQTNQVDPGGRQYFENALATGRLNPQNFFNTFSGAVNQTRQDPNDRYGQYYQNQTGYSGDFQGFMPQMQSPFRYQQPMQQMRAPFSYQQSNYGGGGRRVQQYVDPSTGRATGLADMPQMQGPFSYQQPMQQMQQPMQQPMQPIQPNYGPSQAIVGRSSQMRGTPNVMRRADGGITSLLKKK